MSKTRYHWVKRLIAMALAVVSVVQWIPAGAMAPSAKAAEQSAVYQPGDVNGDGNINALDVNLVRRYIVGGYNITINTEAADVDASGTIDSRDVNAIRRHIAGGYDIQLKPGKGSYTVTFETGGGTQLQDKVVTGGAAIGEFAKPSWAEHIFAGWYYDAALTRPVGKNDLVTQNMTLYANWLEQAPLDSLETPNFVGAEDVAPSFTITVLAADANMTADEVKASILAKDLGDPNAKNVIDVSGANGVFTICSPEGFRPGASYRITLNNDKLTFKDQPQSAREFNFTVDREEAMNLTANEDIKYLPLKQVSNIINNGEAVNTLGIYLYQTDGTEVSVTELSSGSFTYTGNTTVEKGDIVCVYDGLLPTDRTMDTPKDQLGDMAYLEITDVNGTTYTYVSADAEEVVFMPDILPMPQAADRDDDAATITVENKYLDFSADVYSYINLDSQSTVDVGDFFAFYTGEYGVTSGENMTKLTGYGKVTSVKDNNDGTTTIGFVSVSWDEVQACMDVHAERELTGEELLEGVDVDAMEADIALQAKESGFADEAAMYLTSLALATDNFTALSENVNLEDYKITLKEGQTVTPEQLQLMGGGNVEVEIEETEIDVHISTKPTHLGDIAGTKADDKGLAIELEVKVVFTVGMKGVDGHLEITVTGKFIEEVGVDFGVSAEAVWDWAVIIPYISDIRVNAHVDTMNYTAISFNATMITKENEDEDEEDGDDKDDKDDDDDEVDIAEEIKGLLEDLTEEEDEEEAVETQNKLVQRYSEMLNQESDWIRLVEKNITTVKQSLPPAIPLINLQFAVDFVVQIDASISIGFDFEYIEGKRHVFTVEIKDRNIYTDTIELQEKAYQFCFYAMGRIGLKVGVELEFSINVITEKLGSVGFTAGAGAFTKLYGYFFYELKYTESQGKSQSYCGALLIQVGIYLELGLNAKALGGLFSTEAELLDKEWLLFEAGRRDNVLDFVTQQEDMPELVMKQYVRTVKLADDFFNMDYLDLLTGDEETAIYNDWLDPEREDDFRNGANYVITMTNDKFAYDPVTNTISVYPDEEDLKLTGEMIITWKKQPMSFSSKPIQRTVSLYWDNLRDGYMIVPYTNGGSYVPMIVKGFEAEITAPADPERLGYTFAGWYSDKELTVPYTFPELMPAEDTNIYAKWEAATNIPYKVEHYQEELRSGEFTLVETEYFEGTTDSYVEPAVKSYLGYVTPATSRLLVEADGSAILRYYYDLERHNITFDSGKVDGVDVTAASDVSYTLKYGGMISAPQMAMKGYTFLGWSTDGVNPTTVASVMGTEDLTYIALWQKNDNTDYRIEYYVQQPDGRYTLQHMIEDKTATGKVFTEEYLRGLLLDGTSNSDELYLVENGIVFENMTVKGIVCKEAAVDGSGKTVIKVNYGRVKHQLIFDPNYEGAQPIVKDMFYGAEVVPPQNMLRTGYTFVGWEVAPVTVMPTESLTYRAVWKANHYTVKFDKDAANAVGAMANMDMTYDEARNLPANSFARQYYTFGGWALQSAGTAVYKNGESVKNLTATADGQVTLYAVWVPIEYTITYADPCGTHNNPTTYNCETDTIYLSDPVRTGYTFDGWYTNTSYTGIALTKILKGSGGNITLYAKWIPNPDTAYKVEHYQQQLDGSYVLAESENFTGTTDSAVTPAVKSYTGFAAPATKTAIVKADGSLVVKYEYDRKSYTVTFDAAGGNVEPASITAKYGASFNLPTPTREGYGFNGWYLNGAKYNDATMGAQNLTLTADWIAGKFGYTVNHYQQNLDGSGYTLVKTVNDTADMDSQVTPALESFEGFTTPESATITVVADASKNVVNYYYFRNRYTITWDMGIGKTEDSDYTEGSVYFGTPIVAPVPTKTGYSFTWNMDVVTTMPARDMAYAATWTANTYKVTFNTNGGTVVSGDASVRDVDFDSVYGALPVMEKAGYTFVGWFDGNTEITADTVLKKDSNHTLVAKYDLITYTITYHGVNAGENSNPGTYNTEDTFALLPAAFRTGYTCVGWYDNASFTGSPISKIEKGTVGDQNFYAKWEENVYSVSFYPNNGTSNELTVDIPYTGVLLDNFFANPGYSFVTWTDGVKTYAPGTKLSDIVTYETVTLQLSAVWETQKYSITYVGVEPGEHSNASEYTVEDTVSLSDPADRRGYTFRGWFDNSALEGNPIKKINKGSVGHKVVYANWEENAYTVVLQINDGTGNYLTCDPTLYTDALYTGEHTRKGYTFAGWSTTSGGAKMFDTTVDIDDLVDYANDENRITLYAVWTLNSYTVTYNGWDIGSNSNPAGNKPAYTIEDGADLVLQNPAPKPGYEFLGWYEGASKVISIRRDAEKNYNLTAKWAHAGIFTITYTKTSGYTSTYTVKRTLPAGTEVQKDPQVVYIRTVNGTAYGTTPEVATASQQDKYHFIHIAPAKEGSGLLTFTSSDFSKTITVTERDAYNADNPISSYQLNNTARHYSVELYKIVNSAGACQGQFGTKSVKRTMPVSSYTVPTGLYDWKMQQVIGESNEITITDKGYGDNDWRDIYPSKHMNSALNDSQKSYRDLTATNYGFYFTFDLKENNDGYQWVKITSSTGRGGSTMVEYHFATKHGEEASNWGRNLSLPRYNTSASGDIEFNVGDCYFYNDGATIKNGTNPYMVIGTGTNMSICFDAAGKNSDSWKYRNLKAYYRVIDTDEPDYLHVAPLALTDYTKGEYVYLTVVFDEPINSISGTPTLNVSSSKLSSYFESATYVNNGTGTNAITFRCTVKKNLTASDVMTINTYLNYKESAVGGNFTTNIGSISASVGDSCSD